MTGTCVVDRAYSAWFNYHRKCNETGLIPGAYTSFRAGFVMAAEEYEALLAQAEYTPEQIEAMEWEAAMNNLAADEWDESDEGYYG